MSIGIIDYGGGNIQSVINALNYLAIPFKIIRTPEDMDISHKIILPGQGAFGPTMQNLENRNLLEPLIESINDGKDYLGICIGLQLLFEHSEESPEIQGFGLINGSVKKFTRGKIPQIGWNSIKPIRKSNLETGYGYFVNSYYVVPDDDEVIAASTDYFGEFTSAVSINNINAMQFHPEKSGDWGLRILKRWSNAN